MQELRGYMYSEGWSERHETVMEAVWTDARCSEFGFSQYGAEGRERWLLVPTKLVASCWQLDILGYVQIKCPWRPRVARIAQMLLTPEVATICVGKLAA